MPANTVKVDRTTKWGNPFKPGDMLPTGSHDVAQAFAHYVAHTAEGIRLAEEARAELRGKRLACWCAIGAPCHADALLAIANAPVHADDTPASRAT